MKYALTADEHIRATSYLTTEMPKKQSLRGGFVFNPTQSTGYGVCGPYIPCLTCHGKIIATRGSSDWSELKMLTAEEHMLCSGEPIAGAGGPLPCFFQQHLDTLPRATILGMAGNAMHMPVLGAFLLYGLASTDFNLDRLPPAEVSDDGDRGRDLAPADPGFPAEA